MPLPHTNKTISISRLDSDASVVRDWTVVATGVPVYINYMREEIVNSFDNMPALLLYRMMTDGTHAAISVGDRVNDGTLTYEVRNVPASMSDLTGMHHQYLLAIQQS